MTDKHFYRAFRAAQQYSDPDAFAPGVTYKLSCPTTWFDLWGWVGE